MVKKAIEILLFSQLLVVWTPLVSKELFANLEVAFLSSFLIILGSAFGYKKMVQNDLESGVYEEQRDLLDTIEDKHELWEDEQQQSVLDEEVDFKQIVKEEKKKIKTLSFESVKYGSKGGVSLYRLGGYLFLVLGFIALKNNELLNLWFYLPSLLYGVVIGSLFVQRVVVTK